MSPVRQVEAGASAGQVEPAGRGRGRGRGTLEQQRAAWSAAEPVAPVQPVSPAREPRYEDEPVTPERQVDEAEAEMEKAWASGVGDGSALSSMTKGTSVTLKQLAAMHARRQPSSPTQEQWAGAAAAGAEYAAARTKKSSSPSRVMGVETMPEPEPEPSAKELKKRRRKLQEPKKWVVIDGANVAMAAGVDRNSTQGLANCLRCVHAWAKPDMGLTCDAARYWEDQGYTNVVAFVPQYL